MTRVQLWLSDEYAKMTQWRMRKRDAVTDVQKWRNDAVSSRILPITICIDIMSGSFHNSFISVNVHLKHALVLIAVH